MNKLFKTITDNGAPRAVDFASVLPTAQKSTSADNYSKIVIRDMKIDMSIGVYESEKKARQPVLVNLEATTAYNPNWQKDDIIDVMSYEDIVIAIQRIAELKHIHLVETFAEHIADFCLQDERVMDVTVRIEKPEIFTCAAAVGVEIKRTRS